MPARTRKVTTPKVDETVENQENPGTSVEDRSDDSGKDESPVAKMAPAQQVDEAVENQLNPGVNMVDRNPDPVLVTDDAGITRDINKTPSPELVDLDAKEREQEKARIRQNDAAMNAADWREEESDVEKISIEFVESGLTAYGQVWKTGQTLSVEKDKAEEWMSLSESEQKERYKKVFFEKR
jgi:hypothetical protein